MINTRTWGSVVGNTSLRDFLTSSTNSIPASANSGRVSSRIRPFDKAMVMESVMDSSGFPCCLDGCLSRWQAADGGTQQLQFLFNTLVTAINMVNAVYDGIAVGHEAGNDQTGRGPEVRGHDRCTGKVVHTLDDGGITLERDVGTHADQLLQVHEPVLEHGLHDGACAFGHRVHGGELRLHVRGERRVRRGTKAHRFRAIAFHVQLNPVRAGIDMGAGLLKLEHNRFQQIFPGILQLDPTAGCSGSHQVGAGFNTVWQHVVMATMQALNTVDLDSGGTVAFDVRAHGDQALGKVNNLRLAGRVFQDGFSVCQGSGHHQVLGAGYGDGIQEDVGALQTTIGLGLDVAIFDLDLRTHHFQAVDVQVHRTTTDCTATWQGDFCFAEVSHQRTQYQDRGAYCFNQLVRRIEMLDGIGVNFHAHLLINNHFHAHAAEKLNHGGYVMQVRQVAHGHRLVCQQSGCQDWQSSVLGTGNPDFTIQGLAAPDQKFIHNKYPVLSGPFSPGAQPIQPE